MYLISKNRNNFRHGIENPLVLKKVMRKTKGYKETPCYLVLYESDNFVDFIPLSEIKKGNWENNIKQKPST